MGREDHLTRQINQLGYFLRKMLEKLIEAKQNGVAPETVYSVNTVLMEEMGIDLAFMDTETEEELLSFLKQSSAFTPANLELMADVLIAINPEKYVAKALFLYDYVNTKTKEFSFEREAKIKEVQQYL